MFHTNPRHVDESREIADAVKRIHEDPSVLELARTNVNAALDKLGLKDNARYVVAPLFAAALTVVATSSTIPTSYWSS